MLDGLDLQHALIRGRYSGPAISAMQHEGVPIDAESLHFVLANWEGIIDELIERIDTAYGVYDGRHFRHERFEQYLQRRHITSWPRTPHGLLKVDDDTFKEMSKTYPVLEPLRNLRHSLGSMRLNALPIGHDGRNRCLLRQFGARTGRNQPSTAEFIFSPGTWLRFFIKAPPGYAIAYVDWSAAEIGIAAKLSGDENMLADYESGDPHMAIGKANGSIPTWGDKESHSALRDRYKACNFGILYGMGIEALAGRVSEDCDDPIGFAREFMAYHRKRYRVYWEWSELNKDHAALCGYLRTMLNWHVHACRNHNPRSMGNFPIQGGCAEMMRIAAMLATERGLPICCPVHDAFLICGEIDRIGTADAPGADLLAMKDCMAEASRIALSGLELRVDAKVHPYPERYYDKRGAIMWNTINDILEAKYARKII
jgi:DNA polymerase-1